MNQEDQVSENMLLKRKLEELEDRLSVLEMKITTTPELRGTEEELEKISGSEQDEYVISPEQEAFLQKPAEVLVDEAISYLREKKFDFETDWNSDAYIGAYLALYGVKELWSRVENRQVYIKKNEFERLLEPKLRELRTQLRQEKVKQEIADSTSLLNDCVEWAKKKNLTKVAQDDLRAFLLVDAQKELSQEVFRWLWTNTNYALKFGRA